MVTGSSPSREPGFPGRDLIVIGPVPNQGPARNIAGGSASVLAESFPLEVPGMHLSTVSARCAASLPARTDRPRTHSACL